MTKFPGTISEVIRGGISNEILEIPLEELSMEIISREKVLEEYINKFQEKLFFKMLNRFLKDTFRKNPKKPQEIFLDSQKQKHSAGISGQLADKRAEELWDKDPE